MKSIFPLLALLGCSLPPPTISIAGPRVLSTDPPDQATDVLPTVTMQACFDSPLQPASATAAEVELSRVDGEELRTLAVTVGLDASATCLGIEPTAPLSPSSHYQLTLKNGLLGANGVALADSKATDAYVTSFSTVGAPATAVLLVPTDGLLDAPLDLAQVVVGFSAPVTFEGDAGPIFVSPGGVPSTLSPDGRLATSAFSGAPVGAAVQITLSTGLIDPSGQTPQTRGQLAFTMGMCSEATAPNVAEGEVVARDVDAWLQFSTDRPGQCGAMVADPGSADAGVLQATTATCNAPYDPCNVGAFCLCTVPLSSLEPGDEIQVTPALTGYDGQVGMGPETSFQTSPPLPSVVLTEVFPGSASVAFVEVQNRGTASIDLTDLQLADCDLSLGCSSPKSNMVAFGPLGGVGSATLAPNGYALLVAGTFDASEAPPAAVLLGPLYGLPMIHLSTTEFQSLALFMPGFTAPVSTYDGSVLPQSELSLERIDPGATDATPGNWAISTALGGTPGACNSVTPGNDCDP